jgi:hypothetical protein
VLLVSLCSFTVAILSSHFLYKDTQASPPLCYIILEECYMFPEPQAWPEAAEALFGGRFLF